jgi:hypothetical protein
VIESPASGPERAVAGVLVVGAVLFLGFAVPRVATAGIAGALSLPAVLLGADLLIAAAVFTGWYPIRPPAQGLAVFAGVVHLLVALRSGPVWTRVDAGVLVLAEAWGLVALFLLTAAEDEPDAEDEPEPSEDFVETPIGEVVELEPPALDPAAEPTPEPLHHPHDQEERTR